MGDEEVAVLIVFGGLAVAIVAIVTQAVRKTMQTRTTEQSRREIAAYVAEGSISPDDAVRLLEANGGAWKNLKDAVARK